MNPVVRIISIIIYLILTQVYPYVHWHGHEHGDEFEIHLSVHFPDFSKIHEHEHDASTDQEKDQHPHHQHDVSHSVGDWDYTVKFVNYNFKISTFCLVETNSENHNPICINLNQDEFILKLPNKYHSPNYSNRPPPELA